jgi:hypothetical protein
VTSDLAFLLDADLSLDGLSIDIPSPALSLPMDTEVGPPPGIGFGRLIWRPAVYARHDVTWLSPRAWSVTAKSGDLAELKRAKACLDPVVIDVAAADVAHLAHSVLGNPPTVVTVVAPGHSRRSDNFAVRLAESVAGRLGAPFLRCFADRFVGGSSHPKEFRKLPPLELVAAPPGFTLLVDDVASSGFHIEEALRNLRQSGVAAVGIVWIRGTVT